MRRTDLEIRRRRPYIQVKQTFCDKCTQLSVSFGSFSFVRELYITSRHGVSGFRVIRKLR